MSSKNNRRFALGAVLLGAIGYIVGILTAPKSGKETREDLKDVASHIRRDLEKELKNNYSEIQTIISRYESEFKGKKELIKADVTKILTEADSIQKRTREALSAIHDGSATNPELDSLLKEAQTVKEHLIKFLIQKDK